ncbi:MAG: hypothetical protein IPG55_06165 [Saprospiraceae bacterium]|nr:hypothetical protein [Candidatus Defluviibacterium haderslevense]
MIQKTQPDNPQLFFQNPWDRWTSYLQMCDYSKIFIISDSNTKQHCVPYFYQKTGLSDCPQYSIQAGESSKNLSTCEHIWEFCLNNQIDRNSLIIALGGESCAILPDFVPLHYSEVLILFISLQV